MKVIVEQMKEDKNLIQMGDVFVTAVGNVYIASRTEGGYVLAGLDGDWWSSYRSIEEFKISVKSNLDDGSLTQYSQNEYEIVLRKKQVSE